MHFIMLIKYLENWVVYGLYSDVSIGTSNYEFYIKLSKEWFSKCSQQC